jgi:hypothetical protein
VRPTAAPDERRLQQPVINGTDDRREVYELDSAPLRALVNESVAALMWSHRVRYTGSDSVALRGDSLGEQLNLCSDEPFAEQPSLAFCSASLIEGDLMLTAAHCFGATRAEAEDRCRRVNVVFEYELASNGELAAVDASDVYACRDVIAFEKAAFERDFVDVAIFRLDRSVGDRQRPAPLASSAPEVGDTLALAATGAGVPLKVEEGAEVTSVPEGAGFFVAATDSFAGGSGGALFSSSLELVGHQVRGASDWTSDGDCLRAAHSEQSQEQHQLVLRSLAALCASAWPSELCGVPSACGDGLCSGEETFESCEADCSAPRCGDGLCELSERTTCAADCDAFADVPPSWTGDPKSYVLEPARQAWSRSAEISAGCSMSRSRASGGVSSWSWLWLVAMGSPRVVRTRSTRRRHGSPCRAAS